MNRALSLCLGRFFEVTKEAQFLNFNAEELDNLVFKFP
jgi:hypothetical protein